AGVGASEERPAGHRPAMDEEGVPLAGLDHATLRRTTAGSSTAALASETGTAGAATHDRAAVPGRRGSLQRLAGMMFALQSLLLASEGNHHGPETLLAGIERNRFQMVG